MTAFFRQRCTDASAAAACSGLLCAFRSRASDAPPIAVVAMKPRRVTFIRAHPYEITTVKQNSTGVARSEGPPTKDRARGLTNSQPLQRPSRGRNPTPRSRPLPPLPPAATLPPPPPRGPPPGSERTHRRRAKVTPPAMNKAQRARLCLGQVIGLWLNWRLSPRCSGRHGSATGPRFVRSDRIARH